MGKGGRAEARRGRWLRVEVDVVFEGQRLYVYKSLSVHESQEAHINHQELETA